MTSCHLSTPMKQGRNRVETKVHLLKIKVFPCQGRSNEFLCYRIKHKEKICQRWNIYHPHFTLLNLNLWQMHFNYKCTKNWRDYHIKNTVERSIPTLSPQTQGCQLIQQECLLQQATMASHESYMNIVLLLLFIICRVHWKCPCLH